MVNDLHLALILLAALGCGLVAGFFFAFSICVMKSLSRLPPAQGIVAMKSINVVVINPWFMGAFFGTALLCAVLAVTATLRGGPGAAWVVAAALVYIVGTIVVTIIFNVPRNNALARVDPSSTEGARLWADYLVTWTRWNHVRTIAPLVAAALLTAVLALPAVRAAS